MRVSLHGPFFRHRVSKQRSTAAAIRRIQKIK